MKLVKNAVTAANPDLRGYKHHYTIEGADAATLEAMDDMLTAKGWNNDTCPLYEEGFSCGYWIELSDVAMFKEDYKSVKTDVKGYLIAQAVKTEGAEAAADAAGLFDVWEALDNSPMKKHIDNLEYHYVAARNDELAGGDVTTAPQRLFGFNDGDTLRDVFHAVANQAREDIQIHFKECFEAAKEIEATRAMETNWLAAQEERAASDARYADFFAANDSCARRAIVEAAHAEALEINATFDIVPAPLAAVRSKHDVIPGAGPLPRKIYRKRVTSVKVVGTHAGRTTWRVSLDNGRVYLYTEGERYAQVKLTGKAVGHNYQTVESQYTLSRIKKAIDDFQA